MIRALQLLDNNLEPMIRHKPDAKECRVVEDQLKPTNLKKQIVHVRNGIVYITIQTRQGFIDDPDDHHTQVGQEFVVNQLVDYGNCLGIIRNHILCRILL
jgi:hypothetical protein